MATTTQNGTVDGGDYKRPAYNEMTSKDYYFDSYAHFGIHEVRGSTILELEIEKLYVLSSCEFILAYSGKIDTQILSGKFQYSECLISLLNNHR